MLRAVNDMRGRTSHRLTAAQRYQLAKLSRQLELERLKAERATAAKRESRSALDWMRRYNAPLALLTGLLSGAIGGLWGYVTREPPRDPPAIVQPWQPDP